MRSSLPENPRPFFQAKLAAPIVQPPVADSRGRLVIAHGTGKLSQLDDKGRLEWSVRLGPDSEASAPAIARDETRWIITQAGEAVGFGPRGNELYRESVPGLLEAREVALVPLSTGGLALASARQLAELDRRGHLRWLASTPQAVAAVLEHHGALLGVGKGGLVLRRNAEGHWVELADFGAHVSVAALAPDERHVLAIVEHHTLVELELVTGRRRTIFSEPLASLSSLAIGPRGELRLLADGRLIGLTETGKELFRAPVSTSTWAVIGEAPLPLVDETGLTALNLPDTGLVIVKSDGEQRPVSGTACTEPLRPTPLGARRLALSCRSGLVLGLSDQAP